jgi:hypothetical protein
MTSSQKGSTSWGACNETPIPLIEMFDALLYLDPGARSFG